MKDLVLSRFTFTRKFSCISYNVRGISEATKCKKIINKFIYPYQDVSPSIIGFQETKLNYVNVKNVTRQLPSYWSVASVNPGEKDNAMEGVLLGIHKSLNATILDKKTEKGWLILVKCRILDKVCVIGNVYMPSKCHETYRERLKTIDSHLQSLKCDNIILLGDFNIDLDRRENKKNISIVLEQFLEKWELQDAWRIQNPTSDRHSCHAIHGTSRRLDYCFVSLNFMCFLSSCSIGNAYCSDHSLILSEFLFNSDGGRRQFIFPVDLCYSDQFKVQLTENVTSIKKDNPSANPHTLWELIKSTICSSALKFKGLQKRIRKELVEEYESKFAKKMLERDQEPSSLLKKGFTDEIQYLNHSLDTLFNEGKALKYASNLARWYGEKGKCTKYFLNRFKKDKSKPVISQLVTNEGTLTHNAEILKQAEKFYADLFQEESVLLPTEKLDSVPKISPDDFELMSTPISLDELHQALRKMKPSSAPGNDRITVKFYLHFWDLIKEDLFNCFNHAFLVGKLSSSQRQGHIRLIPKKNCNLLWIGNRRPITLLNVDYKILAKLFASRLKDILPDVIDPDQRGFISNRRISHSILDVYAAIETILDQDEDYLICSIDIRKAFNSINWSFLRYVLDLFGFPQDFVQWFNIFYSDRTAYIVNNNVRSNPINITKDNFQGCPLSPLLFVLGIEILASRIRKQ